MNRMSIRIVRHRAVSFVMALCLMLSLCPVFAPPAYADNTPALDKLVNWGVVRGYPDGNLHPERNLTRSEFVAMVNRAYGYKRTGPTPFTDVNLGAWYADDIGIAYNAHYFTGVSARRAGPETVLSREQALVLLARNMRLDPIAGEVTEFRDGHDFGEWSRGYARAAAQIGLVTGYTDGTFHPKNNITRGEMAYMLQRALGTLINTPGTHTLSDVYGNVTLNSAGATLKDSTIAGDLYITGGLDLGDVVLDNVNVLGKIVVAGGGESQRGTDSVVLRNVEANSLLVDSIADQFVTVRTEGDTEIRDTLLRSDSYIQDRTRPGQGLRNISLESTDPAASFTLSGNLENVINKTPFSTLNIAMGTANAITIDEAAYGSTLNLDVNSTASTLNLDTASNVTGIGDVEHVNVNAAGSTVAMLPDVITIRPGLKANIAGQEMDVIQAQESSAEPRLLAGYPRVRSIAPTTATSVFSANKAGKVYWAVSATANGSVDEENLITPVADNTRAIVNGTTDITASNTEATAALTRLTADGSYYLSAVMVDARNRHSPVKVVAFETPDNTTPAFNSGYPVISRNYIEQLKDTDGKEIIDEHTNRPKIDFRAQVSAMANKGCQIYYALYPAGSTAPTAQQFRVGSLGTTVPGGSGVEDVTKNSLWTKTFYGLEELKSYDLYLCLIDADGSRSSAVRKLTFTAMDGTPPVFQFDTPEIVNIAATSLRLRANLSENSTVYWVVLKSGTDYLKVPAGGYVDEEQVRARLKQIDPTISEADIKKEIERTYENAKKLCDAYYKRQIENGIGALRSGSQTARASMDTNININGLTAETSYDIYYIAKDTAGNYSEITLVSENNTYKMTSNKITESTLDTTGPTVTQEFTNLDGEKPLPNTTIRLTFSEDIRPADAKDDSKETLLTYLRSNTYDPDDLASFLSRMVSLKSLNTRTNLFEPVPNRADVSADDADWVIDWRNAVVTRPTEGNSVIVTLPTTSSPSTSALQLKSGATYRFEFDNLTDISSSHNPMPGIPYALPRFTTVTSQIGLTDADVSSIPVDGQDVNVHAAFMMTPVSTNVADSISWDMLIWSDRTVSFDIYQEVGANSWKHLGDASITVDSSMADGSFAAVSLQRSVIGNITEFPRLSNLKDPQYRYAIRITSIGTSTDESSWSGDVNLRVSVVTGSLRGLSNLSANRITEQVYSSALTTSISANLVTDIGSPRPFTLPITFRDTTSPKFATGYPRLVETTDSGVSILTRLDRSGTLYYLMVPADTTNGVSKSSISTILNQNSPSMAPSVSATPTTEVSINEEADDSLDLKAWALGTSRAMPTADQIHSARTYYSDDSYKVGTPMSAGAYNQNIIRNDLAANTRYFVYFVTRGAGGEYSDVSVYTFKTPKASPPAITVYQGTSTSNVDVQVDAESLLTYIVVPYNTAVNDSLLKQELDDISGKITILDALIAPNTSGSGSKFDSLADATQKALVARYISNTQSASSSNSIASALNVRVSPSRPLNVDPSPYMVGSTRYVFLTVGRRSLGADDGNVSNYAFAGYSPLLKADTTPPTVISVNDGGLAWDKTENPGDTPNFVSGKISLSFGEDLYWYNSTQSQKKLVDLASTLPTSDATETRGKDPISNVEFVSVESLVQGSASVMRVIPFTPADAGFTTPGKWFDANVNKPTQVIEIYVKNARVGSSITFTAQVLGDANNNVSVVPLVVSIGARMIENQREPWVTITASWNGTGDAARSSVR